MKKSRIFASLVELLSHVTTQQFRCSLQKYLSQSPWVMQDFHFSCGKESGVYVLAMQRGYNRGVIPAEAQTHTGSIKRMGISWWGSGERAENTQRPQWKTEDSMGLIYDQSRQAPLWTETSKAAAESVQVLASITTKPSFKFLLLIGFNCLSSNAPPPKKENPKKSFYNLLTAKETAQNHMSTKADDYAFN